MCATTCPRCQAAGFVEAGLSGAGVRLGLADGLLVEVVGVWGLGGFVLGGGDIFQGPWPHDSQRGHDSTAVCTPAQDAVPSASPGPII